LTKGKYKIEYNKDINLIYLYSSNEKDYDKYIEKNGFQFKKIEEGIYGHQTEQGSNIYWVNMKTLGIKDPGNVFKLFGTTIKDSNDIKSFDEIRNAELLTYIVNQLFFNKEKIMSRLGLRKQKEFNNTMEGFKAMFLSHLKPEERIAGLGPEQVLNQFRPEERIAGLRPEDIIIAMGYEPVKAAILNKLSTEERLRGLGPEDMKKVREYIDKTLN